MSNSHNSQQFTEDEFASLDSSQRAWAVKNGLADDILNAEKPKVTTSDLDVMTPAEVLKAAKEHRIDFKNGATR